VVREESHLDEMRAAIRGDFERLERRRGGQELLQVHEPAEPEEQPAEEPVELAEQPQEPEPAEAEPPPERSWLDRLLAR
jgi:hypothetical protein